MNSIRSIGIALVLAGAAACSSQPATDYYYSLVLESGQVTAPAPLANTKTRLIVGPIQLARYLNQPGLAMQTGTSRIRTANHHLWAEPLDEAIGKVLVRDIAARDGAIAVDRDAGRWTAPGDCQLRVEFDKFHATDDSRIVATGRYWIYGSDAARVDKIEFSIVQTLSASGYPQAVRQLRLSLDTLAAEIVGQLPRSAACLAPGDGEAELP